MKTPGKPPENRDKDEDGAEPMFAPSTDAPMTRFRHAARGALSAPYEKVVEEEKRERRKKKRRKP
jgi:hypothetical protein